MNMLYEGLKQNSTIVLVPSTAVDSMQLGGLVGVTAMATELSKKRLDQGSKAVVSMNDDNANE
jgi:hypothetical protein